MENLLFENNNFNIIYKNSSKIKSLLTLLHNYVSIISIEHAPESDVKNGSCTTILLYPKQIFYHRLRQGLGKSANFAGIRILMHHDKLIPLFSRKEIEQRIDELSGKISSDYRKKTPVLIGVLKGSFVFLSDMIRRLSIDVVVDFVQISSYGSSRETSGNCLMIKELTLDISNRHVIIVEDIIDTGHTLNSLIHQLREGEPSSIKVCCLINKESRREKEVSIDYSCFTIQDGFVVGFGLDYDEKFRSLPAIYTLDE